MSSIQKQDEVSIYLMNQIFQEIPNHKDIDTASNNITSMLELLDIYKSTSNQKLKFLIDQLFNHTGGSWAKLLKNNLKQDEANTKKVYRGSTINTTQSSESELIKKPEEIEDKPNIRMYRGAPVVKQRTDNIDSSNDDTHQTKKQRIYRGNVVEN